MVPKFREKEIILKNKLITLPIFNSQSICMYQRYTSSDKLFFGKCNNPKAFAFTYMNQIYDQMLSFRWRSKNKCLSANLVICDPCTKKLKPIVSPAPSTQKALWIRFAAKGFQVASIVTDSVATKSPQNLFLDCLRAEL